MPETRKWRLVSIVWGDRYLDLFRRISLPSLASPGNLPALARNTEVSYQILTAPEDVSKIESWPIIKHLRNYASITIEGRIWSGDKADLPGSDSAEKYDLWSDACNKTLAEAYKDKAWWMLWSPDSIFSDGFLERMNEIADTGVNVISVGCHQVVQRTPFLESLGSLADNDTGQPLTLTKRELAALSLKHFHPGMRRNIFNFNELSIWLAVLYFPVPQEGLLVHLYHIPPTAFFQREPMQIDEGDTFDLMFTEKLIKSWDDVYYSRDTDDLCAANLTEDDFEMPWSDEGPTQRLVTRFICKHTHELHREAALIPTYWHHGDMTRERWEKVEELGQNIISFMNATYRENYIEGQGDPEWLKGKP